MKNVVSSERQALGGRIRSLDRGAMVLMIFVLILGGGLARLRVQAETRAHGDQKGERDWSELIASMEKMHMAMGAIESSGNADIDFVTLMLPHHQGAIDMAKAQLLYGKDPQMRRLAQEIITDQQLEIELMKRWLKERRTASGTQNSTAEPGKGK